MLLSGSTGVVGVGRSASSIARAAFAPCGSIDKTRLSHISRTCGVLEARFQKDRAPQRSLFMAGFTRGDGAQSDCRASLKGCSLDC
jgi:hypothetical protein